MYEDAGLTTWGQPGLDKPPFPDPRTAILAEPPPEPPPTNIVTATPAPPVPDPAAAAGLAPPAGSFAVPQAADLSPLDAQGRKIAAAGVAGIKAAEATGDKLAAIGEQRKGAAEELAGVQAQKAQAQAASFEQQVQQAVAYQKRLDDVRRGEEEAVAEARKSYDESLEDAKYAGISPDKRRELQAVLKNPGATPAQQAAAKAQLERASQIDPDQFLGTSGRKITAAIAMALGALGSAMTGGPNHAMQIIQGAIRDNIDAQKHRFAKKRTESADAKGKIDETKADFADDRTNALRDYGIGLEMAKLKLGKITAGLDGAEAVAKAAELQAQLDEEIVKNQHALETAARGNYQASLAQQGGLMTNAAQLRDERARAAAKAAGEGEALQLEGYTFTGKTQPTKPALDRAQKAQQIVRGGERLIDEAIALRREHGSEHGGGPVQARMDVLQSEMITLVGQMSDAGVIQPGEAERFKQAIGNLSGVGFVTDRLQALRWTLRNRADAAARAAGFEPAAQQSPLPGARPTGG